MQVLHCFFFNEETSPSYYSFYLQKRTRMSWDHLSLVKGQQEKENLLPDHHLKRNPRPMQCNVIHEFTYPLYWPVSVILLFLKTVLHLWFSRQETCVQGSRDLVFWMMMIPMPYVIRNKNWRKGWEVLLKNRLGVWNFNGAILCVFPVVLLWDQSVSRLGPWFNPIFQRDLLNLPFQFLLFHCRNVCTVQY